KADHEYVNVRAHGSEVDNPVCDQRQHRNEPEDEHHGLFVDILSSWIVQCEQDCKQMDRREETGQAKYCIRLSRPAVSLTVCAPVDRNSIGKPVPEDQPE